MHEIDLKQYNIRTDMIIDGKNDNIHDHQKINITRENNDKEVYITISFKDITDKNNYKNVLAKTISELEYIMKYEQIKSADSCLVVGLGNINSTPDSLGPKVLEKVLVTKHLFNLGEVEKGYREVAILTPGVTGVTGIETYDTVTAIINKIKPKFIIVVDSLASSNINHLNRIIQISNCRISPGSGIGNKRKTIDEKNIKTPLIIIGVPTVVDEVTIVYDTIKYMNINVSKNEINDVLLPINYNLMVTPKDIDYQIEKLSLLIAEAINKVLHARYKSTK